MALGVPTIHNYNVQLSDLYEECEIKSMRLLVKHREHTQHADGHQLSPTVDD